MTDDADGDALSSVAAALRLVLCCWWWPVAAGFVGVAGSFSCSRDFGDVA